MKIEQIKKIMKKYGKAWETKDPDLIIECFTKNGIYQESPLKKPYKGHKEIKDFWKKAVVNSQKNINFKLGKVYVSNDGKTGFAEWKCKGKWKQNNTWKKVKRAGIMILKMNKDKISCLNEYWNTKNT